MDVGARLRSTREARGLSLGELAARTRVQHRILSAIEENDLGGIPPKPFGRGFVRTYAHEVGLDPEGTVRDYFGQFVPEAPPTPPPAPSPPLPRVGGFGVAIAAVVLVLIATFLVGRSAQPPRAGATDAIGTSGSGADAKRAASTAGVAASDEATANRTPAERPPSSPLTIVLHADRMCWVTAHADGTRVVYRLLPAGAEETVRAAREVRVRAGDAGALRLSVNGRDRGAFGADGEVRVARLTPESAR
jgi:cytoskeletal protein RodZ